MLWARNDQRSFEWMRLGADQEKFVESDPGGRKEGRVGFIFDDQAIIF